MTMQRWIKRKQDEQMGLEPGTLARWFQDLQAHRKNSPQLHNDFLLQDDTSPLNELCDLYFWKGPNPPSPCTICNIIMRGASVSNRSKTIIYEVTGTLGTPVYRGLEDAVKILAIMTMSPNECFTFELKELGCTPLQMAIERALQYRVRERSADLPVVIQLLIDAGADVNDGGLSGMTPIVDFTIMIRTTLSYLPIDLDTIDHEAYIQTMRILLEAGATVNFPRSGVNKSPLSTLLKSVDGFLGKNDGIHNHDINGYRLSNFDASSVDLVKLLLQHGAVMEHTGDFLKIIKDSAILMHAENTANTTSSRNIVLQNRLAELFRCLVLAESHDNRIDIFSNDDIFTSSFDLSLISSFCVIAEYAYSPGRCTAVMELILFSFSQAQVIRHKGNLSHLNEENKSDEDAISVNNAFEKLLDNMEIPRTLKDLSRRVIIRSVSRKHLFSSPDLGLPKSLQRYVLLDYGAETGEKITTVYVDGM